jgi:electron transport complex protein RnfC
MALHVFKGGVHPPQQKNTAEMATKTMGLPTKVVIPMVQHLGAPCQPKVSKGDMVKVGQVIGDTDAYVSAPIHSSVSGTVTGVDQIVLSGNRPVMCVEIKPDGLQEISETVAPPVIESKESFLSAIRASGLTGLGGAAFPAHVKLNPPKGTQVDTLIINAAECEPYITSDYRECMENTQGIMEGIKHVLKWTGISKAVIGIEDNKPDAIKKLTQAASGQISVVSLHARYPQGAEKTLIYALTGRQVPSGKLPADSGCLVMNVTSVAFIAAYLKTGMPLIKKRITIDGSAVKCPQNVEVLIGTPISEVFDFCGGYKEIPEKVIMGGPMMGVSQFSLDLPVLKNTNALIALDEKEAKLPQESACIRCGRCVKACPMSLLPLELDRAVRAGNMEDAQGKYHLLDCIECGCCVYACPAKRRMVQTIRLGKDIARRNPKK